MWNFINNISFYLTGALVHDFKMTQRRLTLAKRKHKAKKQDKSPTPYTGKGKGKGKGQSNRINKTAKKKNNSSDESSEGSDEDYQSPKPGPSSTVAPPLRNAMTLRNVLTDDNAGRRTSSRQSRPPLRYDFT